MQNLGHTEPLRRIPTDWNLYDMSLNSLSLSAKSILTVLVGSADTPIARPFENGLSFHLCCVYSSPCCTATPGVRAELRGASYPAGTCAFADFLSSAGRQCCTLSHLPCAAVAAVDVGQLVAPKAPRSVSLLPPVVPSLLIPCLLILIRYSWLVSLSQLWPHQALELLQFLVGRLWRYLYQGF